tara:strand:+ start:512 stop:712 length:201 start_codon:yes stop_codon:yes gene_type:complete
MILKSQEQEQRERTEQIRKANEEFEKCLEDPEYRKQLEEELDRACEADIADAEYIAYCKANNIKLY